jgi:hypothetical protein
MLRHEASSSPFVAAMPIEEDPSLSLRITIVFNYVMGRRHNEAIARKRGRPV